MNFSGYRLSETTFAVPALTKTAPDISHPHFQSAHTQLKHLLEPGVRIRACPSCLKAAGLPESQLVEGVKLAERDEFFSIASGRILTLDY